MRTEILAGITTFITVAYILILNPQILSHPYEIMGDADMVSKISNGVFIGTCIALGLITHCLILLLTGKVRQIKPLTVIVALIFIARYAFMTLG